MESETAGSVLLSREALLEHLSKVPAGFIKPTDPPSPSFPAFKKMGVLVEIDDIVEAKEEPAQGNGNRTKEQSYSCATCRKTLPTAHLLDLHITEQHDFYFAASVERGDRPMFACFLEECTEKFQSPGKRRDHCISVHKFPGNYRFDQVKEKHPRKEKPPNAMEVDEGAGDGTKDKGLPFVKAFSFGHHTHRAFNTRHEKRPAGETLQDVQAMKDALDDILD
ncbi:hypothetical protein KR018_011919 [Drosophila ironensis]|nr:hypothetical protein KR018_011919 [Drosophila ironensis]